MCIIINILYYYYLFFQQTDILFRVYPIWLFIHFNWTDGQNYVCVCLCNNIIGFVLCSPLCVFCFYILSTNRVFNLFTQFVVSELSVKLCVCAQFGKLLPSPKKPDLLNSILVVAPSTYGLLVGNFLVLVIVLYYKVVVCARYQIRIIVFWSKPCLILPFKQYFFCGCCIKFGTC